MISISEFVDCNNYLLAIDTAADMQIIIIIITGRISSRHRFAQKRNQSKSFRKKSDLRTPAFMVHYGRHDKQTYKQTREMRQALGPKGLIV